MSRITVMERHRPSGALFAAALPLAVAALAAGAVVPRPLAVGAATLDPLPAVARALTGVRSYQVTITSSFGGARPFGTRPRPRGTPTPGRGRGTGRGGFFARGAQNRTIIAVRKDGTFEDYVVYRGRDASGKAITTDVIVYGAKTCTQTGGAKSYACQTTSNGYSIDPTAAFAAGAGATTFTRAASKRVGGQVCAGYAYTNRSQAATATGVVYISGKTHLPCEQDATVTRKAPTGSGTGSFTQKTTTVWSRFNDKRLTVPAVPSA
jgi:hypothetical protein